MTSRNSMLLIGAAVALGMAINVRDGEYWPRALLILSFALAFCAAGVLLPDKFNPSRAKDARSVIAIWVVVQFANLLFSPPSGWNSWSNDLVKPDGKWLYYAGGVLALVAMCAALRWSRVAAGAIILTHLVVGVWLIRATPSPRIDVHVFQQQGAAALLRGHNPYAMTFEDIYDSTKPGERKVYGEELVEGGKVEFGFPYPPLSLYLSTAGYATARDHRYAQLIAITAAAALMMFAGARPWSVLMATMFLFTPRGFFVLGRGWTEPFVVLFLAATVFCAVRYRKLLPVALGLLVASKQHLALTLPLAALLVNGPFRWRAYLTLVGKAAGVALVVTLPFALWNWDAFWHSLVTVQKVSPFREDSLSYLVWFYHRTGIKLGVTPAFIGAFVAIGLALWRAPRTPAGFAGAVGLVYLVFICLNKQAFANYYYFVIGALWCSLAVLSTSAAGSLQRPGIPLNDSAPNVR